MIDLKLWFLLPGWQTQHLEGMNLTNNTKVYSYQHDTGKTMIFTKSPQGFPHDLKSYDQNFIYDMGTEFGWANPKDFKLNTPPWTMCPRYWDGNPTTYQFHPHATYNITQDCKVTGRGDVGPVYYTLERVGIMDFGGNVGATPTILLTYYWTDKKDREQLFLTDRVGWVRWNHSTLAKLSPNTSEYVIDAEVVHNMIVPGTVTPQFPCFPIP